jgi:fructose/tagatose bisphosphate aldolase
VRATLAITAEAHSQGAAVEAELGHLPTAGQMEQGSATSPEEAARFVAATGIDALGVSVGNVHLLSNGQAELDLDRLERIHQATRTPLVLHGGTGLAAESIRPAIARGVAKINYGTRLKQAFLAGVREALEGLPREFNVHDVVGSRFETDILMAGKRRMKGLIEDLIALYGSAGQARS